MTGDPWTRDKWLDVLNDAPKMVPSARRARAELEQYVNGICLHYVESVLGRSWYGHWYVFYDDGSADLSAPCGNEIRVLLTRGLIGCCCMISFIQFRCDVRHPVDVLLDALRSCATNVRDGLEKTAFANARG